MIHESHPRPDLSKTNPKHFPTFMLTSLKLYNSCQKCFITNSERCLPIYNKINIARDFDMYTDLDMYTDCNAVMISDLYVNS